MLLYHKNSYYHNILLTFIGLLFHKDSMYSRRSLHFFKTVVAHKTEVRI